MSKPQSASNQAVIFDTNSPSSLSYSYLTEVLDDITCLAAHICRTPLALLWLSDGTRHWFKASEPDVVDNLSQIPELSSDNSFFTYSIESDLLLVEDTYQDFRFADNPLVTSSLFIRFYAAVPLLFTADSLRGTLAVMDFVPRQLNSEDIETLKVLARIAVTQLELHQTLKSVALCNQQFCRHAVEEREHFFTVSLDMLCITGFDGYHKHLNPRWQETLGYTHEELQSQPYIEFVHPDDREATLQEAQKLMMGEKTISFENRYRCKDGSYKWLLWNAVAMPNQPLIYAAARDITDRKAAEAALRESIERYRSLTAAMEEGIVLQDANGLIQACNSGAERILGLSAAQILGRTSLDPQWHAIHADGSPFNGDKHPIVISLQTGKPCSNVIMGIHKPDGTLTWLRVNSQPLFSPNETKPYAAVATFTDITERKHAEERLRLLESVAINANDAILITEAEPLNEPHGPKIVYVNDAFTRMTGYTFEEVVGKTPRILQGLKSDRTQLKQIRAALLRRESIRAELINYRKDGSEFWVELNVVPLADSSGWYTHLLAVQRDISDRKRVEYEIKSHARASAAVAELGQQALSGISLDALMQKAVKLVAQTLEVPYSKVLELMPGESAFLLKAGVGWQEGVVGSATVGAHNRSHAGYTLHAGEPVVVEDLRVETRFSGTALLHNHRVVSGAAVIIQTQGKVFGILSAHTTQYRKFTEDDVHFLQAVANVLATVIERSSAEEALRESEARYALAVQGSNEGLWDWNLRTETIYFSPRWKAMLGYEEFEISDTPDEWFSRVHPDDHNRVHSALGAHLEGLIRHFEVEYRMLHKDQTYRWILCRGLAVRDSQGKAYRMAGSQTDITDRKRAEAQLIHDAFHDDLTGLPNRALFMDRLSQAMARQRRHPEEKFAVLFLDLDRFKIVNDSLGHVVGDRLLVALARRLETCLREIDTVARLGGDEFVLLLEDIHDIGDATHIADRIQKELRTPFNLNGYEVFITASIGITLGAANTPDYSHWPGDLLRDADIALYRAKELGKARYEVFNTAMHTHAVARLQLENDLRQALEEHSEFSILNAEFVQNSLPEGNGLTKFKIQNLKFVLYYQPIVSLSTGRIVGFEALVRLSHPQRGLVSPAEFIPVAEETGLIIPLGAWVLREACQQMRLWQQTFPSNPPLTISVNLSGRQFSQRDLTSKIEQILRETELEGRYLKLEITESAVMENAQAATAMLQQLRGLDIQLSIDDFGTGYSSLSYLQRFPINTLKIDRSFVSRMGNEQEGEEGGQPLQIVRAIITLAHELNIDVIAEGVETAVQLEQLRALQCEYGQGYFFSKPIDSLSAEALIASRHQW